MKLVTENLLLAVSIFFIGFLLSIIFSKLSKQNQGKGGEIHITDAIQSLIYDSNKFIAHNFSGKYLDCGSMNGYIKSTLEIAKL